MAYAVSRADVAIAPLMVTALSPHGIQGFPIVSVPVATFIFGARHPGIRVQGLRHVGGLGVGGPSIPRPVRSPPIRCPGLYIVSAAVSVPSNYSGTASFIVSVVYSPSVNPSSRCLGSRRQPPGRGRLHGCDRSRWPDLLLRQRSDTFAVYDPATKAWTVLPPRPTNVTDFAAVTGPDGRIYEIGGIATEPATAKVEFAAEVYAYDLASRIWTVVAPLPSSRYGLGAAVGRDGLIYAIKTAQDFQGTKAEVDAYNPATNLWTVVNPLPSPDFLEPPRPAPTEESMRLRRYPTTWPYSIPPQASGAPSGPFPDPEPGRTGTTAGPDGRIYAVKSSAEHSE